MNKCLALIVAVCFCCAPMTARAIPKDDAPSHTLTFEQVVGDNGDYTIQPGGYKSADTYKIVVDMANQVVTVYEKATQKIVRQCLCSTGSVKNGTPSGTYKMAGRKVRFGFFVSHNVYGQYWTQITRSFYFHSLLYTKKDATTWTKSSYNNLGKRASHGCIRLPVPDARWIYFNIAPGTEITMSYKFAKDKDLRNRLKLPPVPKSRPKNLKQVPQTFADTQLTDAEETY